MLVLKWLSVLALAAFAASADADVPELIIDKTYVPTNCPVKSQKGDKIRVHYVRHDSRPVFNSLSDWLPLNLQTGKLTNGNKFDSRCAPAAGFPQRASLLSPTRMQP